MGKSLLNKLGKTVALAGLTGLAVAGATDRAMAGSTLTWSTTTPSSSILLWSPYFSTTTPSVGNVSIVNEATGQSIPSDTSWGLICTVPMYGGESDVSVISGTGNSGSAAFCAPTGFEPSNVFSGNSGATYVGAVDLNNNGVFGTYDTSTGLFVADPGEMMNGVSVSYNNGSLNVNGSYYAVPEPSTIALIGIGAAALASRRRWGKRDKSSKPSTE